MRKRGEEGGENGDVALATNNARMALASVVDGNGAQAVVFVLIVLDVIAVLMELVLNPAALASAATVSTPGIPSRKRFIAVSLFEWHLVKSCASC